ncbi:FAD-dependent oxidoreductase [Acetobacter senegalensis]|uniref:NAD(P)/FAD-dependent oxidoreductase n=1 Tax=Acetobacter senegalensis TaxID=446692 RepID=UPI001EDB91FC|nr:FAD-dependent oxidoreductase [Acetobacter senegalensis]MCG4262431.1 FAD-dependent oxidoreductase [Acetobacter senegalensis]
MEKFDVIIVGGGQAGAQAAIALRQKGFVGSIAIISDELDPPYERPPLSKDYFIGKKDFSRLLIVPNNYWSDHNICLKLGERVTEVDPVRHIIKTVKGLIFSYTTLIWATGGLPRRLSCPGHNLNGIHVLRTRVDADRLKVAANAAESVLIIGGGYVGLESAAVLSSLGKKVTIVEAQERILARVSGVQLSNFLNCEHERHGVTICKQVQVTAFEGAQGHVTGARLSDGRHIATELVLVGIGIIPSVAPLLDAGAEGTNGIMVNEMCQTSLPDIYAIGDCALHANKYADSRFLRLESVQNANDMALNVAESIVGFPTAYKSLPWFWSCQYDLRIQTVGLAIDTDAEIVRGNIDLRKFSIISMRKGRIIAIDCINNVKDFAQGKNLIGTDISMNLDKIIDLSFPLKEFSLDA